MKVEDLIKKWEGKNVLLERRIKKMHTITDVKRDARVKKATILLILNDLKKLEPIHETKPPALDLQGVIKVELKEELIAFAKEINKHSDDVHIPHSLIDWYMEFKSNGKLATQPKSETPVICPNCNNTDTEPSVLRDFIGFCKTCKGFF